MWTASYYEQKRHHHRLMKYCYNESITTNYSDVLILAISYFQYVLYSKLNLNGLAHSTVKYGFYRWNFRIFRTIFDWKTFYNCRRDIKVDLHLVFLYYSAIFLLFQANVKMYVVLLQAELPALNKYNTLIQWRNQHCLLGCLWFTTYQDAYM